MEAFIGWTGAAIYLSIGYVLTVKWVIEEQQLALQDQSNASGQIIATILWPIVIAVRCWNDR